MAKKVADMTTDELEAYRAKERARYRSRRLAWTPEQHEKIKKNNRDKARERYYSSDEYREEYKKRIRISVEKKKEYYREKRKEWEEKNAERLNEYNKQYRNIKKIERIIDIEFENYIKSMEEEIDSSIE